MALLAQTCSKIGTEESAGNNPHVAHGIRVINAGQGVGGEIIAPGWVQLPNVGDSNTKQIQGIPIAGGQIIQQAAGAQGLQLIATQGPNGQIAYVAAPATQNQVQAVNMEGQGEGAFVIPSSGSAGLQGQFILNQPQQGIPVMTANGQIIRAQVPQQNIANNVIPSNVAFANLGGNMVNIGGNLVNLGGGVQTLGAVRPAGNFLQAIQMPQQVQQMPNFIQVPVSANGQTTLMPVQVAPSIQTVQDLSTAASGAATIIAGSLSQSQASNVTSHTTESSSQSNTKTVAANVAIKPQTSNTSTSQTTMTPLNVPVVSFPQLQSVNASGQQTIAAQAANVPSMQLIPIGNGNYVQAMVPSSQTNLIGAGQNVFTLGSLAQSGISTGTVTTAATSTTATAQQSTVTNVLNQVPQIIQTLNGQNFANIQIAGQNQVIANTQNQLMQAINLSNMQKNGQIAVPIQNLQGQGMQAVQNLQSFQVINAQGQVQQIIGTPLTGIQVYAGHCARKII